MSGILMIVIAIVVLLLAYLFYGRWLAKKWGIDPKAKTPAYKYEDGVDYIPADKGIVFGHQFASIAGAGPINGPIQAAMFGWLPVLLWVLLGGIFIGAVQDFASMYASVKNKGRTIGYVIEEYIGKTGKKLFLVFCWLFCILVIAAFADIVAGTFNGYAMSSSGEEVLNSANGSVATTSMIFMLEAVVLGILLKFGKLNKWVNTVIAILMIIGAIIIGLNFPIFIQQNIWHLIVFTYVFLASVLPIWTLLQPRDYLNSYLLIAMMLASVVGVFVANPSINIPAFTGFKIDGQYLFPFMFVTIACGAVSGFHALVSSGTASKQIKNEKDMLPVSFGAMLLESLLAVIALIAVASFAVGTAKEQGYVTPPQIFAGGIAGFLSKIGLPHNVVYTLINLAVSAFALTSLDSVARVGRLSFQEFFLDSSIEDTDIHSIRRLFTNKYLATAVTLTLAYMLSKVGYAAIWPLFGSANQLLSVLAFVACAVFFKKTNRPRKMLYIPIFVMISVTFTALVMRITTLVTDIYLGKSSNIPADSLQLTFAVLIIGLGICVTIQGIKSLFSKKSIIESKEEA